MNICEHFMTKLTVFCLIVGVVLLSGAPPVAAANVNIPDATLRGAINAALGANRAWNAAVTEAEMKTLTSLTATSAGNLTGLEKATNLTTLTLGGDQITDISALSGLTNLTSLTLWGWFTDISALSRLTNLTTLTLYSSSYQLTDISALSGLTNLTTLRLWCWSTNISALSGLTNLTTLTLWGSFTDISALSGLTNLTTLSLGRVPGGYTSTIGSTWLTCTVFGKWAVGSVNPIVADLDPANFLAPGVGRSISNISALSGLTKLTHLDLRGHSISDISALSGLTKLTHLYLGDVALDHTRYSGTTLGQTVRFSNQTVYCSSLLGYTLSNSISNISALSGLTNLTVLDLTGNVVSDLSPLASNTGLGTGDTVYLEGNKLLSYPSIYTHIPALKTRGVTVGTFTNRVPTTLTKVSGDAQNGATSTALANPFVVEVKDDKTTPGAWDSNARMYTRVPAPIAFAGVPVTFAVTAGGGTLSATSVATDSTGRAQVTLTPGATAATQTVTATVTHAGKTLTQTFTAVGNRPPTFTSAATFSVAENTTAVGTVVATDADSQDSVTYSITGGVDSAKFAITNAGALTFAAAPDYETAADLVSTTPANAAGNNQYVIIVTATSGSGARQLTATQTLTITVTDVNEPPGKPGTPTVTAAATTPTSLNVSWTAPPNAGKPAITAYNLRYRKSSETSWTSSTYAGTETNTTLTGLTPGTTYDVQVLAKNHEGDSPWSNSGSATTSTNAVPTFTSAATFSVAENATAVGTVVATDADSADNVTGYTITAGADSSKFAITNAGVLTFVAAPDYDDPGDALSASPANAADNNEYILVVTATSGTAARVQTATQTLTITVTNVPPPGKPAAPTVTVASHTSLTATWTAPTNTGPAIRGYDVQYRKGTTGNFTAWPHTDTAVTTTITGLTAGTSYQVQVLARSSEGAGPWSAASTAYHAEDVDSNGNVDIDDLTAVVSNFGSTPPGRNDVDNDNDVDADDIRAVFAAVLAAEAAAGAPALTHTAKTLQHYLQQTKARGVGANFQRGLAVLEELLEPFLIPDASSLLHNYPNPFNPETWFPYQLATASDVTFSIYSVNGTLIRTLSLGYQAAGVYRSKSRAAYWDGRNALGEPVASGVYFYTLTASDFIATGKMLIRK